MATYCCLLMCMLLTSLYEPGFQGFFCSCIQGGPGQLQQPRDYFSTLWIGLLSLILLTWTSTSHQIVSGRHWMTGNTPRHSCWHSAWMSRIWSSRWWKPFQCQRVGPGGGMVDYVQWSPWSKTPQRPSPTTFRKSLIFKTRYLPHNSYIFNISIPSF